MASSIMADNAAAMHFEAWTFIQIRGSPLEGMPIFMPTPNCHDIYSPEMGRLSNAGISSKGLIAGNSLLCLYSITCILYLLINPSTMLFINKK